MKKSFLTLLTLLTLFSLLVSCASGSSETSFDITQDSENSSEPAVQTVSFHVSVLSGTTGFGIAPLNRKQKESGIEGMNFEIGVYPEASLISSMLISGQTDFAAIPTNLASVIYNKSEGKIKVLAINTLGVLYIAENGSRVNSLADLAGKTVYVPGQGTNPEYVLKILLAEAGILDKVNLDYTYTSPNELMSAAAAGKAEISLLPEPLLTNACSKNQNLRVAVDLSAEWKLLNSSELVQGCLVVRTEFAEAHPDTVSLFMKEYKASCESLTADVKKGAEDVAFLGLASNTEMIEKAIPRCNIVCISGDGMQTSLNTYWKALYDLIPSSVGGKLPDENIFN